MQQSHASLNVSLSSFGVTAPSDLDQAERVLARFEAMQASAQGDHRLDALVEALHDRVSELAELDLAEQFSRLQ